jgi:hypothetical protein
MAVFQLDSVIFCAGILREVWFEKPNTIDLDGFYYYYFYSSRLFFDMGEIPELASEWNTNYFATVTMTTFYLPHFLELSVRRCLHCPNVLTLIQISQSLDRPNDVQRSSCP